MSQASKSGNREPELPGEQVIADMVAAFYRRVKQDDLLAPMYPPTDWEGAEKRLRDFIVYRFGGSDRYIRERGHPRLRMRHNPFKIGIPERDRWLKLMSEAMHEVGITGDQFKVIFNFFEQVADFMRNR
ncbi:MAG: globin [Planctomycetota bacterium]